MPDQFSDHWTRVRDKELGDEYTIAAQNVDKKLHEVLEKPAVDSNLQPLPAKQRVPASRGSASTTKANPADKEK